MLDFPPPNFQINYVYGYIYKYIFVFVTVILIPVACWHISLSW